MSDAAITPAAGSTAALRRSVHEARRAFDALIAPHRPLLWQHCRWLTGDPFAAEDLVQDTLLRAFAGLAQRFQEPAAPRAWLLRIASNRWIDQQRAAHCAAGASVATEPAAPPVADPVEVAEAATVLLGLPPRERAAVALVDGLGLSAAEAAECLGGSEGSLRAALHRGRARIAALRDDGPVPAPAASGAAPDPGLVAAFCAAFNARDLPRLRDLLQDRVEVEVLGVVAETGRDQAVQGSLAHTLAEDGDPRADVLHLAGEDLLLLHYQAPDGGREIRDAIRFTTSAGAIAGYRHYFFCPEVLVEIARASGARAGSNGYRY